jgi:hypothetical protein
LDLGIGSGAGDIHLLANTAHQNRYSSSKGTIMTSNRKSAHEGARGKIVGSVTRRIMRFATSTLVACGLGVASLTAGIAQSQPGPVPLGAWPGCPNDHPQGPCHWCPGDPMPPTGNHVTNPVIWDNNICHTYYYVYFGQGNVAQNIWDGDNPPPPPPPAPPGLINKDNCQQILGIFCPHA